MLEGRRQQLPEAPRSDRFRAEGSEPEQRVLRLEEPQHPDRGLPSMTEADVTETFLLGLDPPSRRTRRRLR